MLNKISVLYQNVRGLKSKLPSLQVIAAELKPTIICINETHLSEDDKEKEEFILMEGDQNSINIDGYSIIRSDRDNMGGGCMIAYRKEIHNLVTVLDVVGNEKHECTWITVGNHIAKIKLGVIYMPGEETLNDDINKAYTEIEDEINKLKQNEDIFICGDFNAKLKIKDQNESSAGKILNSFVKRNKLCVMNYSDKCHGYWTRVEGASKSVIDYIITSSDSIIERMEIDEERSFSVYHNKKEQADTRTIYSDHNAILTHIYWKGLIKEKVGNHKVRVMTEKGLQSYKNELHNMKISSTIDTFSNVKEEYEKWEKKVTEVYEKHKKSVKRRIEWKVNRQLIQIIKQIKSQMKNRNNDTKLSKLRIHYLKQHCEEEIRGRFRSNVKGLIGQIKESGRTNMQPFWKFNRTKNHSEQARITIRKKMEPE